MTYFPVETRLAASPAKEQDGASLVSADGAALSKEERRRGIRLAGRGFRGILTQPSVSID